MSIVEELRAKASRDNRDLLDRAADRIEELEKRCERRAGEWEKFHGERFICSSCAKVFNLGSTATLNDVKREWKFCPECGAKMKGE